MGSVLQFRSIFFCPPAKKGPAAIAAETHQTFWCRIDIKRILIRIQNNINKVREHLSASFVPKSWSKWAEQEALYCCINGSFEIIDKMKMQLRDSNYLP